MLGSKRQGTFFLKKMSFQLEYEGLVRYLPISTFQIWNKRAEELKFGSEN